MRRGFLWPMIAIIAIILGLLVFSGVFNMKNPDGLPGCGTVPPGSACFGPTASATLSPVTATPATATPEITAAPTAATTNDPQSTFSEDARLLPPETFNAVARPNGMLLVSWTWPAGRDLDPTFFRVNVQGTDHDFDFTGAGDYEEEVPAYCGGGNNFLTLDAFNTDVQPEANSQAENVIEIEPDC